MSENDRWSYAAGNFTGILNFSFSSWSMGGLITSHSDPSSRSFISDRLLSEISFGELGTSQSLRPEEVTAALKTAFKATEDNVVQAVNHCQNELVALKMQLEQLETDQLPKIPTLPQKNFLNDRIKVCHDTMQRLRDCVTVCLSLIRNDEIFVAYLGDFHAIVVEQNSLDNEHFNFVQVASPHDLFNASEHERLHSLGISSSEMNSCLSKVGEYKDFPKFVRCFAGDFTSLSAYPICAVPTIYGPISIRRPGFIAIFNSSFYNTVDQECGEQSNVYDFMASNIHEIMKTKPAERISKLKALISSWLSSAQQTDNTNSFYIRWFDQNQLSRQKQEDSFAPLSIDVSGENGFPSQEWEPPAGTVVTADHIPRNIQQETYQPFKVPSNTVLSKDPSPAASPQESADFISTYVKLLPTSLGEFEGQQNIDKAFNDFAKTHLSPNDLDILGL